MKRYFPGIFFFAAVGKRPGVAKKPDPAALNQLIAQKGAEKPACLYVGDSNVDVETAHNAGIRCCGAAEWGFRGYRELKEAGADCFAKSSAGCAGRAVMKPLKKARVSRRRFVRLVQTQTAALGKPCESGTLFDGFA